MSSMVEPEPQPAARVMCHDSHSHAGHFWSPGGGPAQWCTGVQVVRWYNVHRELEQQSRRPIA